MVHPKGDHSPIETKPWGVTPGMRVWIGGHNAPAKRAISQGLKEVEHPPTGPIDRAFIAPLSVEEGIYFASKLRLRLMSEGAIWMVLPVVTPSPGAPLIGEPDDLIQAMVEGGFVERGRVTVGNDYQSLCFHRASSNDRGR